MTSEPRRDLPERTFQFALHIVTLCQLLDTRAGVARVLARQLLRSGTSVGTNVEEGQGAQTEADFLTKYSIACKEARETHYWLRLLSAAEVLPAEHLRDLTQECNELVAILTASVKRLKERRHDR